MSTERPLLAFPRKDLEAGPKHVRAALPAAWLTTTLGRASLDAEASVGDHPEIVASIDGELDARLTPSASDQFVLQGRAKATVNTTCGRCLGPATVDLDAELTLLLVAKVKERGRAPKGRTHKESEGEFEFDGSEADVSLYDGETIILDEIVREALLLELPISPLCSEECPGMSADPAVAEKLAAGRVDPRLAPLAALLSGVSKETAEASTDEAGSPGKRGRRN